jgi:hypothetical protein
MEKQLPFTGILSNKAEENHGFFFLPFTDIAQYFRRLQNMFTQTVFSVLPSIVLYNGYFCNTKLLTQIIA